MNGPKKGGTDDVLFSAYPRTNINGEPYSNAGAYIFRVGNKLLTPAAEHDRPFRPAKKVRLSHNAAFDHLADTKHVQKNYRNDDGEVITAPRNIVTNKPKIGNVSMKQASFGGLAAHMPDDFNAPKKLARKELDYHLSKLQE